MDAVVFYPFINAAHILGIGLLLGAILPLDLRLIGLFRSVPLTAIGPFLTRTAMTGAILAALTGVWLFSVSPGDYLANPAFRAKAVLLGLAMLNVTALHLNPAHKAAVRGDKIRPAVRLHAALSLILWLMVLLAGRWIGFV